MIRMTLKQRVWFIGSLVVAAAVLQMAEYLIDIPDFIHGISVGLMIVAMPVYAFLLLKYQKSEDREDYDLSVSDERVINNCNKAYAIGFKLQSALIIAILVVCYNFKFDYYLPVIGGLLVSIIFSKTLNFHLNKG